jgi:hypothetical protein
LDGSSFIMDANIFEHNAQALRALHNEIEVTFAARDRDEEHYELWAQACQRFRSSFDRLAFPGGLDQELSSLKRGDAQAIEMAVRYLESNPWYFRSGYIKEELLQRLKRVALTENQRERLRVVIIERINKGSGREFRRYCRLAKDLMNSALKAKVKQAMTSNDVNVSRRAGWVMNSLSS